VVTDSITPPRCAAHDSPDPHKHVLIADLADIPDNLDAFGFMKVVARLMASYLEVVRQPLVWEALEKEIARLPAKTQQSAHAKAEAAPVLYSQDMLRRFPPQMRQLASAMNALYASLCLVLAGEKPLLMPAPTLEFWRATLPRTKLCRDCDNLLDPYQRLCEICRVKAARKASRESKEYTRNHYGVCRRTLERRKARKKT
jgi:hypothetical protein